MFSKLCRRGAGIVLMRVEQKKKYKERKKKKKENEYLTDRSKFVKWYDFFLHTQNLRTNYL